VYIVAKVATLQRRDRAKAKMLPGTMNNHVIFIFKPYFHLLHHLWATCLPATSGLQYVGYYRQFLNLKACNASGRIVCLLASVPELTASLDTGTSCH
jgi:hypothetical protein